MGPQKTAVLLLCTITVLFSAQASSSEGCPANKSVLLLGTSDSVKTAAISAADDAFSALPCHLSLLHEDAGSTSSPLDELVQRLNEGELRDTVAVLYPGHSEDTTVIAQILSTNILRIPLVTFAFPPVPTSSLMLPYHIQMVPSESVLPLAVQTVIEEYRWNRVALLTQDTTVFVALRDQLLSMWKSSGVDVIHDLLLEPPSLADTHPDELFADDIRVFVLNMDAYLAREVVCNARHLEYHSSYVWVTYGWYSEEWWKSGVSDCTGDELEEYLNGALGVSHFPTTPTTTSDPTTGGLTGADRLVHDAVWGVALAFNHSLHNWTSDEFRTELYNLTFIGASGQVSFENGVRTPGIITVSQYRKGKALGLVKKTVGLVNCTSTTEHQQSCRTEFTYLNGEDESTVWPAGVPSDGTPVEIEHYPFLALMVLVYLYAATGLVFTVVCLIFNIVFHNRKLIRLGSPTLNYLILFGAALLYLSSLGFFYPEGSSSTYITTICILRTFVSSLGYSLAYGTINAKMWRVYYICTKPKPTMQGVPLKDWHLMLMVLVLVLVDSLIAVIVLPLDNARPSVTIIANKQDPGFTRNSDGIKEVSVVSRCTAPAEPYWLGVLFGYKIVFQAIGVFLAFKIRKVKIRGLNESREVSAILYITSVILVAMIVATFPLGEYIDVEAVIFGVGICTATTVVLALTFVPKMWGLYRDPEGKNVLKGTVVATGTSSGLSDPVASNAGAGELLALQTRIRDLEQKLLKLENSTHNHKSRNTASTGSE